MPASACWPAAPHGAIVALEPAIDEFIEFDFFHARSQLGERELTKEDFEALREQLAPHRFDLAIDLRKHLSTRDVLRYTGARFLAGYDYIGPVPVPGHRAGVGRRQDAATQAKPRGGRSAGPGRSGGHGQHEQPQPAGRCHAAPIPLHAAAGAGAGVVRTAGRGGACRRRQHHQAVARGIFHRTDRPVAGTRPGERAAGRRPGRSGRCRRRSCSTCCCPIGSRRVAGTLSLADLPRLLVRCRLYIGNDSGPKHIAAACGGADDRHPFRRGGCGGMGAGRAPGRSAAAEHGLQPVLPGAGRGLPPRPGLPASAGTGNGARGRAGPAGPAA